MIDNLAIGVQAAQARAWIVALLINASQMRRAFCADVTLGTAVWRSTLITRTARTNRAIVHHTTDTVWTARRWHARILIWNYIN